MTTLEDYTVENLKFRCRLQGIEGYEKLSKKELYDRCVLMRPPRQAKVQKVEGCLASEKDAKKCIAEITKKYPDIFARECEPPVEGPASGLIIKGRKVIGVATPTGEIKAVLGTVTIPPPPPLPPAISKEKPKLTTIPKVQVSEEAETKTKLEKDLDKAREQGKVISASDLKAQLNKLKEVQKEEVEKQKDAHEALLESIKKGRKKVEAADIEAQLAKARKKARQIQQARREKEDPREALLAEIRKRKARKSSDSSPSARRASLVSLASPSVRCQPPLVYDEIKGKCTECSDYDMVYSPSLGKCVGVKSAAPEVNTKRVNKSLSLVEGSV